MSSAAPEPFWVTANGLRTRCAQGDDVGLHHLEDVTYHLDTATEACQRAVELVGGYEALVEGRGVGISAPDSVALLRNGDAAIRGAVSAIDTALMGVNQILGLGIPSTKVTLGAILRELRKSQPVAAVADAIEEVTRSIMFESLQQYRNWVTHRGAPRISAPGAAGRSADASFSLDEWVVTCYPFVPPVFRRRLDAPIQIPALKHPERVVMPDGKVAFRMFEEVSIHAGRVTLGDLDRDADDYTHHNKETLELGRVRVGGEELAQYSAREFIRSVHGLGWKLRNLLAFDSSWDVQLATASGLAPPAMATE
jgi:hypothetical protein